MRYRMRETLTLTLRLLMCRVGLLRLLLRLSRQLTTRLLVCRPRLISGAGLIDRVVLRLTVRRWALRWG